MFVSLLLSSLLSFCAIEDYPTTKQKVQVNKYIWFKKTTFWVKQFFDFHCFGLAFKMMELIWWAVKRKPWHRSQEEKRANIASKVRRSWADPAASACAGKRWCWKARSLQNSTKTLSRQTIFQRCKPLILLLWYSIFINTTSCVSKKM